MRKVRVIHSLLLFMALVFITSCNDKESPGKTYMPDMVYSRAYEAYATHNLDTTLIRYTGLPVPGTVRRGDLFPYTVPNDTPGYILSASIKNPLPVPDSVQLQEAGRLYNINCGICHGPKMDAQSPLAGKVGGIANLTLPQFVKMPEGQMYHVVTYGKGNMGSYASQLDRRQRWMVVQYVKAMQSNMKSDTTSAGTGTVVDSAAVQK